VRFTALDRIKADLHRPALASLAPLVGRSSRRSPASESRYESRYDHPRNCRASVLSSSCRDVVERTLVRIHLEEHDRATIDPRTASFTAWQNRTPGASCNVSDLGFSCDLYSAFLSARLWAYSGNYSIGARMTRPYLVCQVERVVDRCSVTRRCEARSLSLSLSFSFSLSTLTKIMHIYRVSPVTLHANYRQRSTPCYSPSHCLPTSSPRG